ncbi:MAG: restriction endonuclease subunit S [Candidatus Cloacimonetes bacterium]|nr:restriction endonuclease subunit S [Candidatus Cloacimonadota bacterium]
MNLKPYPKYKKTDIEWIDEIPECWKQFRVKDVTLKITSGVTPKGGSEVYLTEGITFLRSQNVYDYGLEIENVKYIDNKTHRLMRNSRVLSGNILINITGASIGRTCLLPDRFEGNINQHIACLKLTNSTYKLYISIFLKSHFVKSFININQLGASKEAFNLSQIASIPILFPPLKTQQKIAAYLDKETSLIDRKIALLEQKIEKYEELRKALINETVCRGLDKNVELKDSGIEWIGKIPKHWEVKRLKDYNLSFETGRLDANAQEENGIYPFFTCSITTSRINNYAFDKEALLIAGNGDIGNVKYFIGKFNAYQRTYILSKFNKINVHHLKYNIESLFKSSLEKLKKGSIIDFIKIDFLRNYVLVLPDKNEQIKIVNYLNENCQRLDKITLCLRKQIIILKELRKTLINDIVTGKIQVPE